MSINISIFYKGKNNSASEFVSEMTECGAVDKIRAEEGNLSYEYFTSVEDPETVLLLDSWRDQAALDIHHASPMMKTISDLREKYQLTMKVERSLSDEEGIPLNDRRFIKEK